MARDLLGRLLLRAADDGLTTGRIVEVEAYLAHDDPACHSYAGQTRRNTSMFGPPGHAYVYSIHARWCLNFVTEPAGVASAVLIRAVEPREGVSLMQRRRGVEKLADLARGPARLAEALAVDRALDGWDLTRGQQLWVADDPIRPADVEIVTTTRVGVTSAHELPLRFYLAGSPYVSKPNHGRGLSSV